MRKGALLASLGLLAAAVWWFVASERLEEPVAGREHAVDAARAPAESLADAQARPHLDAELESSAEPGSARTPLTTEPQPSAPLEATVIVRIVSSDDGSPLPGEPVTLFSEQHGKSVAYADGPVGKLGQVLLADAQGRCEFRIAPGVRARAVPQDALPSHTEAEVPVDPLAPGEVREVTVVLPVLWHWVRAEDAGTGAPLSGVRVWKKGSPWSGEKEARTDANGLAGLLWSAWRLDQVSIDAEGYGPALVGVQPGHETPQTAFVVQLSRSGTLRGHVLLAGDAPAAGARIEVSADGVNLARTEAITLEPGGGMTARMFEDRNWSASTDVAGAFTLRGLPPAIPLHVKVSGGAGQELKIRDPIQLAPGEEREVTYRLGGGTLVRGLVRNEAGAPVPGCVLWLCAGTRGKAFSKEDGRPERNLRSGADGRFEIPNVAAGDWELGPAPRSGYLPLPVAVRVPEGAATLEVFVEALPGLFVAGCVVGPDGEAVPGVTIATSGGPVAESDRDGAFRVGLFAAGAVTLNAWAFGSGFADPPPLEVQAGDENVLLRLDAGGRIAGRVVDIAGLSNEASVQLTTPPRPGIATWITTTAHADGEFAFDRVRPGSYGLVASSASGSVGFLEVQLTASSATVEDLVIHLAPGGQLRLRRPSSGEWRQYVVRSGACVLAIGNLGAEEVLTPHLPAGAVTVELRAPGKDDALSKEVIVRAGETIPVDISQ